MNSGSLAPLPFQESQEPKNRKEILKNKNHICEKVKTNTDSYLILNNNRFLVVL